MRVHAAPKARTIRFVLRAIWVPPEVQFALTSLAATPQNRRLCEIQNCPQRPFVHREGIPFEHVPIASCADAARHVWHIAHPIAVFFARVSDVGHQIDEFSRGEHET